MAELFANGYALLVGVTQSQAPGADLPDVAKDIAAVYGVLTDPQRCAYPAANAQTLVGEAATRQGILEGLDWLRQSLQSDGSGNATALIYYSGHGWRDASSAPPVYYLIPYDVRRETVRSRALRAEDFAAEVAALNPHRLLVVLDCCHAGGMGVKDVIAASGWVNSAASPALLISDSPGTISGEAAKGLDLLSRGSVRAVLSSSQGAQLSYMRKDGKMSIFTYHLIEALTGHARPAEGATEVLVSDVMGHVWRRVPESARRDWNEDQQPDYQMTGNFPVALLSGGKGLSKDMVPPDPLAPGHPTGMMGSPQINTGGGAFIAGNVYTRGGAFVGRDKIVQGDETHGDKLSGDDVDRAGRRRPTSTGENPDR